MARHPAGSPGRRLVEGVEAGLLAGLLVLAVGGLALAVEEPWLFPSLAPSIYLHVMTPQRQGARPLPTFLGHMVGMVGGSASVWVTGARFEAAVTLGHPLAWSRLFAAVLALTWTMFVLRTLRISNPAASATALLFALGGIPATRDGALSVTAGALLVALLGEAVRRFVLGRRDIGLE